MRVLSDYKTSTAIFKNGQLPVKFKQDRQCKYTIILRHVCATTVAGEKQ